MLSRRAYSTRHHHSQPARRLHPQEAARVEPFGHAIEAVTLAHTHSLAARIRRALFKSPNALSQCLIRHALHALILRVESSQHLAGQFHSWPLLSRLDQKRSCNIAYPLGEFRLVNVDPD